MMRAILSTRHQLLKYPTPQRQQAQIHIAAYQQQIRTAHHKVKVQKSQVGDSVLKHMIQTTRQKDQGKIGPNWEGLYIIIAQEGKGSDTLADQDEKILKKHCNTFHLK